MLKKSTVTLFVDYIISLDKSDDCRKCLSLFRIQHPKLKKSIIASKIDDELFDACKIAVDACRKADNLLNQKKAFSKDAGFITKAVLKILKLAQGSLAFLLLKSPLRVAFAYTALHTVIKYLEKEHKKEEQKQKKDKQQEKLK